MPGTTCHIGDPSCPTMRGECCHTASHWFLRVSRMPGDFGGQASGELSGRGCACQEPMPCFYTVMQNICGLFKRTGSLPSNRAFNSRRAGYNVALGHRMQTTDSAHLMQCMEVWGGNQNADSGV